MRPHLLLWSSGGPLVVLWRSPVRGFSRRVLHLAAGLPTHESFLPTIRSAAAMSAAASTRRR